MMDWIKFFFSGSEIFTLCYLVGQFLIFAALLISYYFSKSIEHKTLHAIRNGMEEKKENGEVLTIPALNDLFKQQSPKSKYVQQWNRYYEQITKSESTEKVQVEPYFGTGALHFAIGERGLLEVGGGIHTTIGVLGTFIGLTYGLSGLNVVNPAELRGGIDTLLSGMTTAFLTSIMGIVLSLIWIFIDRKLTMKLEEEIDWHAHELSALLQPTDEEVLLNQLEKIAAQHTEQMTEALEKVLTPFMERLVEQNELMQQYIVQNNSAQKQRESERPLQEVNDNA